MQFGETFIHSQDRDWEQTDKGVQRKILGYDQQVMMVQVQFEKGAIGTVHQHEHRQVTFVEEGVFEVTIQGKTDTVKKGDSFFVEPNAPHGVEAKEAGCLIDVFTPVREDFL